MQLARFLNVSNQPNLPQPGAAQHLYGTMRYTARAPERAIEREKAS